METLRSMIESFYLRICETMHLILGKQRFHKKWYCADTKSTSYRTASLNPGSSSQILENSGHRSMSMTQASHAPYTVPSYLHSHSMRGNPDRGLIQRPRSPFAYPARLKRPGFRPSSPALTDDGSVDYSRRAEIDRLSMVCYRPFQAYRTALTKNKGIWLEPSISRTISTCTKTTSTSFYADEYQWFHKFFRSSISTIVNLQWRGQQPGLCSSE